jgi:hypothetical protein
MCNLTYRLSIEDFQSSTISSSVLYFDFELGYHEDMVWLGPTIFIAHCSLLTFRLDD